MDNWEELLINAGIVINDNTCVELNGNDISVRQLPGIDEQLEELRPDVPDEVLIQNLVQHRLLNQAG